MERLGLPRKYLFHARQHRAGSAPPPSSPHTQSPQGCHPGHLHLHRCLSTVSRNGERNCSTPLKNRWELPENVPLEATPQYGVGNHCDHGGPLVFSETPTMPWTDNKLHFALLYLKCCFMETCCFIAYLSCFNIKLITSSTPLLLCFSQSGS